MATVYSRPAVLQCFSSRELFVFGHFGSHDWLFSRYQQRAGNRGRLSPWRHGTWRSLLPPCDAEVGFQKASLVSARQENPMNRRAFLKTVPAFAVLAAKGSSFAQDAATAPSPGRGPAADRAAQARDGRRQVGAGGPVGEKDDPQHQRPEASPADAVESPVGGVRREPGKRSARPNRTNGRVGQQLAGDRPLRRPARGDLSLRGRSSPPDCPLSPGTSARSSAVAVAGAVRPRPR